MGREPGTGSEGGEISCRSPILPFIDTDAKNALKGQESGSRRRNARLGALCPGSSVEADVPRAKLQPQCQGPSLPFLALTHTKI